MKRLFSLLLALVLLSGCGGAGLRAGYYLLPLDKTDGVPLYFRLDRGGGGYVHAMGQELPVTWTREGLEGDFSDGVPTDGGLEFPSGEEPLVLTWSRELPEGYADVFLRPGYYVPQEKTMESLLTYAHLRPDGTGYFSIMGMEKEITWTPEVLHFGEMSVWATAEGFRMDGSDSVPANFRYVGEELPEGYLPDPPAPGVYAVSSVGHRGDTSYFGALSKDNGYLELGGDGTGTLVFDGESYPFVMDGMEAVFEGWSMVLLDMSGQDTGGPAMVMGYTTAASCPIEADSIAFRLLKGE